MSTLLFCGLLVFMFIVVTVQTYRIAPEIPIPFGAIIGVFAALTACLVNMEATGWYIANYLGVGWGAFIGYFVFSWLMLVIGMLAGGTIGGIYGHYVYKLRRWFRGAIITDTKKEK